MQGMSILTIEVLVLFTEALLFGCFLVLYTISVWVLMYREPRNNFHPRSMLGVWMFGTTTLIFVLLVIHLCYGVQYALLAFVDHSSTPGGPLSFFKSPTGDETPAHIIDPAIFAVLTLIGNSFMTYRIYAVWGSGMTPILLPVVLLVANAVSAIIVGSELGKASVSHPDGFFSASVFAGMVAYFVLTLLTNLALTLLLLGRLVWSARDIQSGNISARRLTRVHRTAVHTIVLSEAVHSIAVILNLAAYVAHSDLVLITFAALPPLIGISFTIIIIRVGLSEFVYAREDDCDGNVSTLDFQEKQESPIARGASEA